MSVFYIDSALYSETLISGIFPLVKSEKKKLNEKKSTIKLSQVNFHGAVAHKK